MIKLFRLLLSPDGEATAAAPAPAKNGKLIKVKALQPLAEDHNGTTCRHNKGEVFEVTTSRLAALGGLVEKVTLLLLLAVLAFCLTAPVQAQQYASRTLLSIQNTNVAGATTNIGNIGGANTNYLTLTKWDAFDLEVRVGLTNASAATISLNWSTSDDGLNWANTGDGQGWFSVPLTNGGTTVTWRTNISAGSYGYYKLGFATNAAVQHVTNFQIRAFLKPQRYGGFGP